MEMLKYIAAASIISFLIYCLYRYQKMEAGGLEYFKNRTKLKLDTIYRSLKHGPETYKFFINQHQLYWVNVSKTEIEEKIFAQCDKTFGTPFFAVKDSRVAEFSYRVDEQKKFVYFVPGQTDYDFENCNLIHHDNHS